MYMSNFKPQRCSLVVGVWASLVEVSSSNHPGGNFGASHRAPIPQRKCSCGAGKGRAFKEIGHGFDPNSPRFVRNSYTLFGAGP